jgi:hypothetical protein
VLLLPRWWRMDTFRRKHPARCSMVARVRRGGWMRDAMVCRSSVDEGYAPYCKQASDTRGLPGSKARTHPIQKGRQTKTPTRGWQSSWLVRALLGPRTRRWMRKVTFSGRQFPSVELISRVVTNERFHLLSTLQCETNLSLARVSYKVRSTMAPPDDAGTRSFLPSVRAESTESSFPPFSSKKRRRMGRK